MRFQLMTLELAAMIGVALGVAAARYGLAEAASAQDFVEQGHTEGKVVLKIAA